MNGLENTWSPYQDQDAASDAELPIKGKLSFKERTAAVGREAALQKQLQEAIKDHQDLWKRFEVKDQKCNELRDKLKVNKAALASRERELELAQRMLQKLSVEKTHLRDEFAEHKVYVRKLEAKLDELKNAAAISSRYQTAKQKANDLQQQLVSATAELAASKEVAAEQLKQINRLNRAVEIRASELSQEAGGQDIPAKLLHSLAEAREESLELAKQLASTKADMNKLKQSASRLTSRVETAELMRADAEVAAEQLKQRLEKLLGSSQEVTRSRADMAQLLVTAQTEAESYKSERDELAEVVLEMQEEIEHLKAATAAAKADGELAAAAAADEAMHRLADTHAAAEDAKQQQLAREAHLTQRCTELAAHASQMEAAMQQQLQAAQQTSHARQQQIMVLESQLANRRQRELDLEHQVAELQLRTERLGGAVSSAEAAASRTQQLEQQVVRLEASLRVASVERQQLEQRLKQAGDDAAAQQQEVERELDALRVQVAAKEAAHRCTLEDNAELQKQLGNVMQQLDKITASKAELQDNMLHQITSIKKKLQVAEQQSQQQLMAHSSPIFPARAAGQNTTSSRMQRSGATAAAALDAARSRLKVGTLSARQQTSSQATRSPSPGSAAARSAGKVGGTGRHSVGFGSTAVGVQRQRQRNAGQPAHVAATGSSSRSVIAGTGALSKPAGQHLAQTAVARVAEFADSLQHCQPMGSYSHQPICSGHETLVAAVRSRHEVQSGLPRRPSSSHAMRPTTEPVTHISSRSILRRSLDDGTILRPGSIHGIESDGNAGTLMQISTLAQWQEGRSCTSAAAGQVTSPPESHFGVSSGGVRREAVGHPADVPTGNTSGDRLGQQQRVSSQHGWENSRSLADDIDRMSWLDILKADTAATKQGSSRGFAATRTHAASSLDADLSSMRMQLYTYSPQGHRTQTTAAATARSSSSHISSGTSRPPAHSAAGNNATNSEAQQRQHAVPDSHKAPATETSTTYSNHRSAGAAQNHYSLAGYEASSYPAEASNSRPQSLSTGHGDLSWLQQPMEPYSPTVAARGSVKCSSMTASHHAQPAQLVVAGVEGAVATRHGDDLADPYSLPETAEQSAASVHAHGGVSSNHKGAGSAASGGVQGMGASNVYEDGDKICRSHRQQQQAGEMKQQQQAEACNAAGSVRTVAPAASGSAAVTAAAACTQMQVSMGDFLHSCGAWEVTVDSDSSSNEQLATDDDRSSQHSNSNMRKHDDRTSPQHADPHWQHVESMDRTAGIVPVEHTATGLSSLANHGAFEMSGSPAHSIPSSPTDGSQHKARSGGTAASSQQLQNKLQATRAALRELSSKKRQAGTTAHRVHFPGPLAAEQGDQQSQQLTQTKGLRTSGAGRQQVSRAPEPPQIPKEHQQQMRYVRQSRAARFASHGDGGDGDRRSSDSSSSGSNRQSQEAAAEEHDGSGVGFVSHAAKLLSPPSTGKVLGVATRIRGVQRVPIQGLEGDATCSLGVSSNRASMSDNQRQGTWAEADEGSGNRPTTRLKQMHEQQQQQQQHGRAQSPLLASGAANVHRLAGHQGTEEALHNLSNRAVAGSRMSAMDSLLAKLSEGEPTLQDLAELESML